jgi:hypothetical protein
MRQELIERAVDAYFHPYLYDSPQVLTRQEREYARGVIMDAIDEQVDERLLRRRRSFDDPFRTCGELDK